MINIRPKIIKFRNPKDLELIFSVSFLILVIISFIIYNIFFLKIVGFTKCFLYEKTGLLCPACGGTRAVDDFLKGSFYRAFRYNGLFVTIFIFFLFYCISVILNRVSKGRIGALPLKAWYLWILLTAVILFTIIRNVL